MRYFVACVFVLVFSCCQAQQINPVPDYVFRNQMSVGRNAVTDTAAYFSIGPRFGATKGIMPPMVVDTASFSGSKRNGLLIFSVQKNKYVYWDSVGSKWAEMAGVSGSALTSGDTATMLAPYTRGSGTTTYIPKFNGTRAFVNSALFDSSGTIKMYKSHIGNGLSENYAMNINLDGIGGRPLLIRMSDSNTTGPRNAFVIRRTPFSSFTAEANYGTGFRIELPNGSKNFTFAGNVAAFITDSTTSTFSTQLAFGVMANNVPVNTMRLTPDSSMVLLGLMGTGTRYVRVDANGDFSAPLFDTVDNGINLLSVGTDGIIRKTSGISGKLLINETSNSDNYTAVINGTNGLYLSSSDSTHAIEFKSPTGFLGGLGIGGAYGMSSQKAEFVLYAADKINIATGGPNLRFVLHSNGGLKFVPLYSAPTAEAGTVYYDGSVNKLKVYDGSSWVDLH